MTTLGKWAWHVHHGHLVERLTEGGLPARRKYIRENKPASEIETRLRLLKPVKDQKAMNRILKAFDEAEVPVWKAYDEVIVPARKVRDEAEASAEKAYDEAVASAQKAYEAEASAEKAFDEAVASAQKAYGEVIAPIRKVRDEAVDRLHKKECKNCPWNGETIFP